jgi:hypothetical protein
LNVRKTAGVLESFQHFQWKKKQHTVLEHSVVSTIAGLLAVLPAEQHHDGVDAGLVCGAQMRCPPAA